MTHYETLGVSPDASADDIKDAYRRLSLEHHPDRKGGDEARMRAINEAYDVLSDPKKRDGYDAHAGELSVRITNTLRELFSAILERDMAGDKLKDFMREAQGALSNVIAQKTRSSGTYHRRKERLQHMVGRVTSGEAVNVFADLINAEIAEADGVLLSMDDELEVLNGVKARLDKYKDSAAFVNDLQFPTPSSFRK